jgi:hypothetical protein
MRAFIERVGWPQLLIVWSCGLASAVFSIIASDHFHLPAWALILISFVLGSQAGRVGIAIYNRIKRT